MVAMIISLIALGSNTAQCQTWEYWHSLNTANFSELSVRVRNVFMIKTVPLIHFIGTGLNGNNVTDDSTVVLVQSVPLLEVRKEVISRKN